MLDYAKKPIIAMLHLMGWGSRDILERIIREANIYYENGVDAVVTTGSGTGEDSPTEKLMEFRKVLGTKPLIVGAGVTSETVAEKLRYSDGVIIGSWLKEGHDAHGEVNAGYVREFMESVRKARTDV